VKVIVAGSRTGITQDLVEKVINEFGLDITEIVSGGARGVDTYGELWAQDRDIPITRFKPDWGQGRTAGKERNWDMGHYADALIAVWDGMSPGTAHMIAVAEVLGLLTDVYAIRF
jgi:hypothetical protein